MGFTTAHETQQRNRNVAPPKATLPKVLALNQKKDGDLFTETVSKKVHVHQASPSYFLLHPFSYSWLLLAAASSLVS